MDYEKIPLTKSSPPPPRYTRYDENPPPPVEKGVKQVMGVRRSSLLLALYVMFYIVYLVTGGLLFAVLEAPGEEELKNSIVAAKEDFLIRNPCVQDDDLEGLIEKIITASNRGVSAAKNATGEPNWSFGQSFFFAATVVTTIGYGHVTPLSKAGKCFCLAYATIGIPLTLMLLTALVERIMILSALSLQYLNYKLGHLYQPFNIRLMHLSILFSILFTFFLFIPAAVFTAIEPDWDYLDSVYYCFISLTTIGLGDYIPGDAMNQPYRPIYKVFTAIYLLVGLVYLVFTLSAFYEIPQLNFGLFFLLQSDLDLHSPNNDSEKTRLLTPGTVPNYTDQVKAKHTVLTIKTRTDDSPSPDDPTPVHAKPLAVSGLAMP